MTDARTLASPNIVIVLVGNKKDLEADREVTFMEASRFAQENGEGRTLPLLCDKPVLVITEIVRNSFVCVRVCCRVVISGDECSDRRECGGGLPQVYQIYSVKD